MAFLVEITPIVRSNSLRAGLRRLKKLKLQHATGQISTEQQQKSTQSWIAHLNHADTWRLQQKLAIC